ncbi:MAG: hypothetical protein FWE67_07815 [Planctomycetaceae bacterium]|nr:hypothetical protein [Planctomycetaceae bacterium]
MYRLLLPLLLLVLCPGTTWSTNLLPSHLTQDEILATLDEPFTCDFKDEISLAEALSYIGKTTNIEIDVDNAALKELGITTKSPVKFRLPFPLPLRDALNYLVKQHGIDWNVVENNTGNNVLLITSQQNSDRREPYRSEYYFVGDFLQTATPTLPPKHGEPIASQPEKDLAPLIDYIKIMIAPESWKDGDIQGYFPNSSLVVRQREDVHEQIVKLLNRLRKIRDTQVMFEFLTPTHHHLELDNGKGSPLICFNGIPECVRFNLESDTIVRIAPVSAEPIPKKLAEYNEPFMLRVPKGPCMITIKCAVRPENEIKTTVTVDGQKPETRLFYVVPFHLEEKVAEFRSAVK